MVEALLEREDALAALSETFGETSIGRGRMVFVTGEAGVGKTALLRAFCQGLGGSSRVLAGACDALATPRPLGPLLDVATVTGGALSDLVQLGAPPTDVYAALRDELAGASAVVVLEDLHWADEATLDVLRLLARRIEGLPALVLATYRDDALDRTHPVRVLAGDLATVPFVGRIVLEPLSASAVAELAAGHAIDPAALHTRTGGNPFFVVQALEAGATEMPATVRDAVLSRLAGLCPEATALVELAAIAPPRVEPWLLEALAAGTADRLDECIATGVLAADETGVAFRHELARLAVEESLTPTRRRELHRRVLAALAAQPVGGPDPTRLAHHAEAAGDAEAVLEYAPAAAARAASVGASREAAAQYARALRFADGLPRAERAVLLEGRAEACYQADDQLDAIGALEEAIAYRRLAGDPRRTSSALAKLTLYLGCRGLYTKAEDAAGEALRLLERDPWCAERAQALDARARIQLSMGDRAPARDFAGSAVEIAERCGDEETMGVALVTLGITEIELDLARGRRTLERAKAAGQGAGRIMQVVRSLNGLAWGAIQHRSHALAEASLREGIELCTEHALDLWRINMLALLARSQLDQGRWTNAADTAMLLLEDPRESPWPQFEALLVLALVRARRGDPEARVALDEAQAIGAPSGELESVAALACARAELAWLERRTEEIDEATVEALDLALQRGEPWAIGALACWRRRAGLAQEVPAVAAEPYRLQLAGRSREAAEAWSSLGCPYEAALALAESEDEHMLRRALTELQQLGARPAATIVSRSLRERGARDLPRGPLPRTLDNPAQLTARELEVLRHVQAGLRSTEIAERLIVSPRTVDHHVAALMRKLGARTRGEAGARAAELGMLEDR